MQERKAATLPRPYDRKKIEERRQEVKKKTEERKEREREKEKERMVKSEIQETKGMEKPPPRMSRSFVERMAAPKHPSPDKKEHVREPTPVKVQSFICLPVFATFHKKRLKFRMFTHR